MAHTTEIAYAENYDYLPHDHVHTVSHEANVDGRHQFAPFVSQAVTADAHVWERTINGSPLESAAFMAPISAEQAARRARVASLLSNTHLQEDAHKNTAESLMPIIQKAQDDIAVDAERWASDWAVGLLNLTPTREIKPIYGLAHLASFAMRRVILPGDGEDKPTGLVPEPLFKEQQGVQLFRAPKLSIVSGIYVRR